MTDGLEVMKTALALPGEMGLGDSTSKMTEQEEMWHSVRSGRRSSPCALRYAMAIRCPSDDGEIAWNIWNPLPTALSHYVYGLRTQDLLSDEDVGKVAFTCHFVVDILYEWTHTA